jgi:hypothetical protein
MAIYIKLKNQRNKFDNHSEISITAYEYPIFEIPPEENLLGEPYCVKSEGVENISLRKELIDGKECWRLPYSESLKPTQGISTIKFKRKNNSDFSLKINVAPSIFSEDDFYKMVNEIGIFALNYQSFMYSNRQLLTYKESLNTPLSKNQLSTSSKQQTGEKIYIPPLERLIKIIENHLNNNALKSSNLISKSQIFRIEKSTSSKDLIKRQTQPHKRLTIGQHKSFQPDSPENQWLKYIIHFELLSFVEKLQKQFQINSDIKSIDSPSNERILNEDIELLRRKISQLTKHPFFTNVTLKRQRPQTTTKLLKLNGYSQIYQHYHEIFKNEVFESFKISQQIQKFSPNLPLENLAEIYEIWCLSAIYHSLCQLGFQGDALYHSFTIKDHQIKLKNQHQFKLSKPFANGEISCVITYQAKLQHANSDRYYTPDIKIDITAPKRHFGLEHFSIILDPKYKNFPLCNEKNNIITEILSVAMYKYHQQLEVKPDASFILHPVSNQKFHWLGEQPLFHYLDNHDLTNDLNNQFDKYFLTDDKYTSFVAHKFAAAPLRPKCVGLDIRRLFTLIFHYHMGLTSLCLCCGRELKDDDEFFVNNEDNNISITMKSKERTIFPWNSSDPSTKFRAVCKECNNEWRISFCRYHHKNQPNAFNRIIKIGRTDENLKWFPIHRFDEFRRTACPSCGNIYIPNKQNIRPHHYENEWIR